MSTTTALGSGAGTATAFATRKSYPLASPPQKTAFQGLSVQDAKRGVLTSFVKSSNKVITTSVGRNNGLVVKARKTAGANIEVEVDKPLGLTLGPKPGSGGGVIITGVDGSGNAAKSGLKVGDQVIYTSSFFGDELWPADRLGFTKTAIQACPDAVYFVVSRGVDVDVKRLPKRPAPPRFGRKLTDAQKARATHICLDCGFIYTLSKPFEDQPDEYLCPQCRAPKKRFTRYDPETGKPVGGTLPPIGVIIGLVAGLAGVGALLVYGLQ
ncbi:rubredoxin family protein [Artemisia annua]|uniref:Rubredoxin family protein n=1 Tax=Artemisia annua TaxID=35608 RepID=A0A2U1P9G4_ARTAN|nr:rubredoxin family protein [Artemisia annua]